MLMPMLMTASCYNLNRFLQAPSLLPFHLNHFEILTSATPNSTACLAILMNFDCLIAITAIILSIITAFSRHNTSLRRSHKLWFFCKPNHLGRIHQIPFFFPVILSLLHTRTFKSSSSSSSTPSYSFTFCMRFGFEFDLAIRPWIISFYIGNPKKKQMTLKFSQKII